MVSREAVLTQTLVQLADTLVDDDFDVVDVLTMLAERCVEILDVSAAGLMLISADGDLRRVASSSDTMRLLEIFEEVSDEGPCPDCYRTGQPVVNVNLASVDQRWPRFAPRAVEAGFRSVHALPMRVRGRTIGAMNLFRYDEGHLSDADIAVAQALADVATISIVTQRAVADAQALNEQLQQALNSRVIIEQAKGIIAEALKVDLNTAFSRLRNHARDENLKLSVVAEAIIDKTILPEALHPPRPQTKKPFSRR